MVRIKKSSECSAYRHVVFVHSGKGLLVVDEPSLGAESVDVGSENGAVVVCDPTVDANNSLSGTRCN
jgi:hypothetical protein